MASGAATRPITDLAAYKQSLTQFVYRSGLVMKPIIDRARQAPKRIVFAEGEDRRVLRAAQTAVDEGFAQPILVGEKNVQGTYRGGCHLGSPGRRPVGVEISG